MTRFCKYQLIGGATLCALKSRKEYIDCWITTSCEDILYLSLWFIYLISYRQNGGRRYRQGTWARLIKRDGRKCKMCGIANEILTIDHIIPLSRGGHPRQLSNLQILCKTHNYEKGNLIWNYFLNSLHIKILYYICIQIQPSWKHKYISIKHIPDGVWSVLPAWRLVCAPSRRGAFFIKWGKDLSFTNHFLSLLKI